MKLAQLKWIGMAALAAGLSAGGVVAVGYASAPGPGAPQDAAPVASGKSQKETEAPTPPTVSPVELRIKSLEARIDRLVERLVPPDGAAVNSFDTRFAPARGATNGLPPIRAGEGTASPTQSIAQLEVALNSAMQEFARIDHLHRVNSVAERVWENARGRVLLLAAQVETLDDEFRDELERLELELRRREAQLEKAKARMRSAQAVAARTERLNQQRPGTVSPEEEAKAEGEYRVAMADSRIAGLDIEEVKLRLRQQERQRDRLKKVVRLAEQAKKDASSHDPGAPPARP